MAQPERLPGKRVAILATAGVEQVELTHPRQALDDAGATTIVVSPKSGTIEGWQHDPWGDLIKQKMVEEFAEGVHAGRREAAQPSVSSGPQAEA
jgi:putative intracellular protease/amidase